MCLYNGALIQGESNSNHPHDHKIMEVFNNLPTLDGLHFVLDIFLPSEQKHWLSLCHSLGPVTPMSISPCPIWSLPSHRSYSCFEKTYKCCEPSLPNDEIILKEGLRRSSASHVIFGTGMLTQPFPTMQSCCSFFLLDGRFEAVIWYVFVSAWNVHHPNTGFF